MSRLSYNFTFVFSQIEEKVEELLEERDKLHGTWQERKEYLRQLLDQQLFFRDANQLETISVTQEVCSVLNVVAGDIACNA